MMKFLIEYAYEKEHPELPKAAGYFHYQEAETEEDAIKKAEQYINNLLYARFKENIEFKIKAVEVLG